MDYSGEFRPLTEGTIISYLTFEGNYRTPATPVAAARNACHSGKVALSNLLVNHNAAGSDIPTKVFRELKERPCDPAFERQETSCGDRFVCYAQTGR